MRVAVIGAGIMGASSALSLVERAHDVTLFEQFGAAHELGSSHGNSRIIRKAYPDPFYTAIMDEAYGLWHELQEYSRDQIVFETGLLYYGKFESDNLRDVIAGLQQHDVTHELLDPDQVRGIFPKLNLNPGEIGIFTPEAGWVHAGGALQTTLRRFQDLGGLLEEGAPVDIQRVEAEFDCHVLCPGAWIRDFVPVPVEVTLQTFGYIQGAESLIGPAWIEDCPRVFYGFPSEPGTTAFKVGVHEFGPEIDPRAPTRPTNPEHMEAIREQVSRRFGLDGVEIDYRACLYTTTANEDFLFGRHGDKGFFVSACSGHGFKFGPWMGRKLADFVEEKDAPESHPRFCWPIPLLEA